MPSLEREEHPQVGEMMADGPNSVWREAGKMRT